MALPDNLDPKMTYMISGKFINDMLDEIRKNKIILDENSPIFISEVGPDGTRLALDTTTC